MAHYLIAKRIVTFYRCSTNWATSRISGDFMHLLFLGGKIGLEPTTHGSLKLLLFKIAVCAYFKN